MIEVRIDYSSNTYYIWSFDGRLMAEYDQTDTCTREYIYLGNTLLAEYHPPTGKYYYQFQDQVNSTRLVTDDDGNVVYSATYGPYGDIQKEWVNTYHPKQKYSGKERDSYTDLDYFGARYYDNTSYRFISVDPVRNREEAIVNPQLWNLYSYCRNNPVTYFDPNGEESIWKPVPGAKRWYYRKDPPKKNSDGKVYQREHYHFGKGKAGRVKPYRRRVYADTGEQSKDGRVGVNEDVPKKIVDKVVKHEKMKEFIKKRYLSPKPFYKILKKPDPIVTWGTILTITLMIALAPVGI